MTDAPFWVSLTDSFSLVLDAPNKVNIPGKYKFWLGIWEVTLEIDAPCDSNFLQGNVEKGYVSVYIDELVVLVLGFRLDDNKHSWEEACGYI